MAVKCKKVGYKLLKCEGYANIYYWDMMFYLLINNRPYTFLDIWEGSEYIEQSYGFYELKKGHINMEARLCSEEISGPTNLNDVHESQLEEDIVELLYNILMFDDTDSIVISNEISFTKLEKEYGGKKFELERYY